MARPRKKIGDQMVKIFAYVKPEVAAVIDEYAKLTHQNRSSVIRACINQAIQESKIIAKLATLHKLNKNDETR